MSLGEVLIIEDERELAEMLASFLAERGYTVSLVCNCADFIQYQASDPVRPQVVVVDRHLPGISLKDVGDFLRQRFVEVPAVLITAHSEFPEVERENFLKSIVLFKPFRLADLIEVLEGFAPPG